MPGFPRAADRMLGFFRLEHLADEQAGGLSYGQQKLLDAAMAFMAGPRLALLDEPAGGVNLTMLASLRERLKAINVEQGATFVVIEHNMEFVMALCDRILVLAEGRIIARGRSGGGPPRSEGDRGLSWPLTTSCAFEDVVAGYGRETILRGLSFGVRRGAITTVIGPNGAGKSTAFKAVVRHAAGARPGGSSSTAARSPTTRRAS